MFFFDRHLIISMLILPQDYPFMRHLMNSTSAGAVNNPHKPPSHPHVPQNLHVSPHLQSPTVFRPILIAAILHFVLLYPLGLAFHRLLAIKFRILSLLIIEVEY